MSGRLDQLVAAAADYRALIEGGAEHTSAEFTRLLERSLAGLYYHATALIEVDVHAVEPEIRDKTRENVGTLSEIVSQHFADFDLYWRTASFYQKEPLQASLANDIIEIYTDVRDLVQSDIRGTREWLWQARFDFETHWGIHAVHALTVLRHVVSGRA